MPIERKLAAIMFTDIAGYTESMSKSESKTLNLLEKKRSILKPLLKKYKGTFVKEIGDGTLSYFESAVNAATCAVKLQETTYDDKEMNIRVGIHIGDIVFKDGDVFGGGVNVASRLESIAPAGGVCVSKSVYDELSNQDDFDGIELGLQSLKGVGRLIEVFGLKGKKLNEPDPKKYQDNKIDKHSDDEVPSIAIIPFDNKGKEEDVFYAYGISVDLISDVTSAGLIRVASKKQIEDAGDLPIDELANKLDVRYMANGELWRMGDMFQLSVELYDTKDKKVVWSDRWQEKWDNLPAIKMNLSDGLLKALDTTSKIEKKLETTNTKAYEFYLKAKHKYEKRENMEDIEISRGLLNKAIELDNNLIYAKGLLGWSYFLTGDIDKAFEIINNCLKQSEALENKPSIAGALNVLGIIYSSTNDVDKAEEYFLRSLQLSKELNDKNQISRAFHNLGINYGTTGDYEKVLDYYNRSLKIAQEIDDKRGSGPTLTSLGAIYNEIGDYEKAYDFFTRSIKLNEEFGDKRTLGWSLCKMGEYYLDSDNYEKAVSYLEKALKIARKLNLKGYFNSLVLLYLCYKNLGNGYDKKEIQQLIKKEERIDYKLYYNLYQLLEDTSYLETAYNQVQEKADNLEPDVAAKFLSYPIPKAIVEEWEKVK